MASKAEWLKVAKDLSKGSSKAVLKALAWLGAGIFCIQMSLSDAYECGAQQALSKVSETCANDVDEDGNVINK